MGETWNPNNVGRKDLVHAFFQFLIQCIQQSVVVGRVVCCDLMEELHTDRIDGGRLPLYRPGHVMG